MCKLTALRNSPPLNPSTIAHPYLQYPMAGRELRKSSTLESPRKKKNPSDQTTVAPFRCPKSRSLSQSKRIRASATQPCLTLSPQSATQERLPRCPIRSPRPMTSSRRKKSCRPAGGRSRICENMSGNHRGLSK